MTEKWNRGKNQSLVAFGFINPINANLSKIDARYMKMSKEKSSKKVSKKSNKPIKTFRLGSCSLSIWEKEIKGKFGKQTLYNFSMQRSYKDDHNQWQHTTNFSISDIKAIEWLLNEAYNWVALQKQSSKDSEDEDEEDEESEEDEDEEDEDEE